MHIDIVSDPICPWCFIGKRRLEQALGQRPELNVSIRWQPFFLNPDMPADGMPRNLYLNHKFGSPERAAGIYQRVRQAGADSGIAFRFEAIKRTPNTLNSHRLIRFAERAGLQTAVVEALFTDYFLHGSDIGDSGVLLAAAVRAGLDGGETATYLAGDAGRAEIMAQYRDVVQLGVSGVPFFIVDRRYTVQGAQPAAVFLELFDRLQNETRDAKEQR